MNKKSIDSTAAFFIRMSPKYQAKNCFIPMYIKGYNYHNRQARLDLSSLASPREGNKGTTIEVGQLNWMTYHPNTCQASGSIAVSDL